LCLAITCLLLAQAATAQGSIYFGATINGETYGQTGAAPTNQAAWDLFERHAGKKVAILAQGQGWAAFDKAKMDATSARGAIPLVTMGLEGATLEEVVNGKQDAAIRGWAQAAKAWGHPFLFAPWWEMNGAWYPWGRSPQYVPAWRHFHDLVVQEGATNVTWTWLVNSIWSDPESDPTPYYPGDAYVDWTGLDSYNWGRNLAQPDRWIDPDQTLSPTLKIIEEVAPAKPVAIVEDASSELGGNKTDWIREMLTTYLPHHPEIGAYLWFNWNFPKGENRADWPIESSATAQQEFRKEIQSSVFVGGPVSLPSLTKVAPPVAPAADPPGPADLSTSAEMATGPEVAIAADGTATVVWSGRGGGGDFTVFARRISPDGVPGAIQQLSPSGQDALDPRVAVAPDGTAAVAWTRFDGSNFLVQARRILPGGSVEEGTKNLSTTGQNSFSPQVAVGADGTATIVWKKFDGFHYLVQERRIAADGTREASFHTLSASKQDAIEPEVAAAADGTATVVWSRFDGSDSIVQERQIGADGTPAEATRDLSAAEESAIEPRVAIAPDGTATVVWVRSDGANQIVQARRIAPGDTPEPGVENLSAAGRSAAEPELAVGADGVATVVWDRWDGGSFVVQLRRLSAQGVPGATLNLSASGRDAAEPRLALGPAGVASVVWSRFNGANFIVQRRDVAADGTLAATQDLSAAGRSASDPSLAWGSDGTFAATWRRFDGAGDVVQAKLVPKPPPPPPAPEAGQPGTGSGGEPGTRATAVDNSFQLGKARLNRRRGTATLPVTVPGAGGVSLAGAVPQQRELAAAGTALLRIVPKPAGRRVLARRGVLRLRLTVTFAPSGGVPNSRALIVRLRKSAPAR
jgi:Glycosyl hydrolase family 26